MASADPATGSDLLTEVTCLDASSCWAVGADGVESGANQNNQNNQTNPSSLVEHWNGSTWSIEPSPNVTAFSYLDRSDLCPGVDVLRRPASPSPAAAQQRRGDPGP